MTSKITFILLFFLFSSYVHALPTLARDLILKGKIVDGNDLPIPFATIETRFKKEGMYTTIPKHSKLKADSLGNYTIRIKQFGEYKLTFSSKSKIPFSVTCNYIKNKALLLRSREFTHLLDIQLLPQTTKLKTDIYNGINLNFDNKSITSVSYKRYIQTGDYKLKKGFKTQEKLLKYLKKKIKKNKLKKLMRSVASRAEIDLIIESNKYSSESRYTWHNNFGNKAHQPDLEQERIEFVQKVFYQINEDNEDKSFLFGHSSTAIDQTKTKKIDSTKQIFTIYRLEYINDKNQKLSYDFAIINSVSGWKIAKIFAHQVI